jgi:hypothetical protein
MKDEDLFTDAQYTSQGIEEIRHFWKFPGIYRNV